MFYCTLEILLLSKYYHDGNTFGIKYEYGTTDFIDYKSQQTIMLGKITFKDNMPYEFESNITIKNQEQTYGEEIRKDIVTTNSAKVEIDYKASVVEVPIGFSSNDITIIKPEIDIVNLAY